MRINADMHAGKRSARQRQLCADRLGIKYNNRPYSRAIYPNHNRTAADTSKSYIRILYIYG